MTARSSPATVGRDAILRLLVDAHGDFVPAEKLRACCTQYRARLRELKRRFGPTVEIRSTVAGQVQARVRLGFLTRSGSPRARKER